MSPRAQALTEKALWSSCNRSIEADLRSDLAQVLVPFVLEEVGLQPEAIRQEGTGRAGRFDSMLGEAILEYKRPQLLRNRRERETAAAQDHGKRSGSVTTRKLATTHAAKTLVRALSRRHSSGLS
jgi:hypothetical protein